MRRFVYSPDVQVYIETAHSGILDLSPDIVSGSVTRRLNAESTAELIVNNRKGKYLQKITPMDRIVIFLQRVHTPQQVFAGYVNDTTFDQLYPGPINITASCSLKRLNNTYFDPGLPAVHRMLAKYGWTYNFTDGQISHDVLKGLGKPNLGDLDILGGVGELLRTVMHEIGGWPIGQDEKTNSVWIYKLPDAFVTKTSRMFAEQTQENADDETIAKNLKDVERIVKLIMSADGVSGDAYNPGSADNAADYNFDSIYTDSNPLPKNWAGKYQAKIYGPSFLPNNFAQAFLKQCQKDQIVGIGEEQATNAATIFAIARAHGYSQRSALGWIAASYPESTITAWKVNSSSGATGLFQLLSGGFYGPDGLIAKVIKEKTGRQTNPQLRGSEAKNATWNTEAIMRDSIGVAHKEDVQSSAEPHTQITQYFIRPGDTYQQRGSDYWNKAHKVFIAGKKALALVANTPDADPLNPDTGAIGDVKVSNAVRGQGPEAPAAPAPIPLKTTFRIKGNPYGDDTIIFSAASYDKRLSRNEISIYVPGAKDKSTPQAQEWHDKQVVVETSAGRAQRFKHKNSQTQSSTTADPKQMTQKELVGPGGVSTSGLSTIGLAGLAFIQKAFGPFILTAGYATSGHATHSDHYWGGALDLVPVDADGKTWSKAGIARTDALAKWAGWSANTGGNASGNAVTRWVGWRTEAGHGPPGGPTNPSGPHIHISFIKGAKPADIPAAGSVKPDATGHYGDTGVSTRDTQNGALTLESIFSNVLGSFLTLPTVESEIESLLFKGERALANDIPLMKWVQFMCLSSGRVFQSSPKGDFIASYPDYFNWSQEEPYFIIDDIEIEDLNILVSDKELVTHLFTTGDTMPNGVLDFVDKLSSTVSSIEKIKTLDGFINFDPKFSPVEFLQRYGARPKQEDAVEAGIRNSMIQFMYGWMKFLEYWSRQFIAEPKLTFMPELWPGGLVQFKSKDLVMFVEEVTHTFDRQSGFSTTPILKSPSTASKIRNYGMVLAEANFTPTKTLNDDLPQTPTPHLPGRQP